MGFVRKAVKLGITGLLAGAALIGGYKIVNREEGTLTRDGVIAYFGNVHNFGKYSRGASISPDGSKVAYLDEREHLYLFDRKAGIKTLLTENLADRYQITWSRDGTRIVYLERNKKNGGNCDVWITDFYKNTNITNSSEGEWDISLSPDNSRIAFIRNGKVLVMSLTSEDIKELSVSEPARSPQWSPDGNKIIFSAGDHFHDIYLAKNMGKRVVNLTNTPKIDDRNPVWSRDGKYVAFECGGGIEGSNEDICLVASRGGKVKRITDTKEDEVAPVWTSDDKELFVNKSGHLQVISRNGKKRRDINSDIKGRIGDLSLSSDGMNSAFRLYEESSHYAAAADLVVISEYVGMRQRGLLATLHKIPPVSWFSDSVYPDEINVDERNIYDYDWADPEEVILAFYEGFNNRDANLIMNILTEPDRKAIREDYEMAKTRHNYGYSVRGMGGLVERLYGGPKPSEPFSKSFDEWVLGAASKTDSNEMIIRYKIKNKEKIRPGLSNIDTEVVRIKKDSSEFVQTDNFVLVLLDDKWRIAFEGMGSYIEE